MLCVRKVAVMERIEDSRKELKFTEDEWLLVNDGDDDQDFWIKGRIVMLGNNKRHLVFMPSLSHSQWIEESKLKKVDKDESYSE